MEAKVKRSKKGWEGEKGAKNERDDKKRRKVKWLRGKKSIGDQIKKWVDLQTALLTNRQIQFLQIRNKI